jgi:hypothetical protein
MIPYAFMTYTLLLTHSVAGPDTDPSVQVVTPSVLSTIPFHLFYFRCLCGAESAQTEAFFALSHQFLLIVKGLLVGCTQLLIPDVQRRLTDPKAVFCITYAYVSSVYCLLAGPSVPLNAFLRQSLCSLQMAQ